LLSGTLAIRNNGKKMKWNYCSIKKQNTKFWMER